MNEKYSQTNDTEFSRYDVVLVVIPVAFGLAFGISTMTSLSTFAAALVASMISLLALGDSLFINPPVDTVPGKGE